MKTFGLIGYPLSHSFSQRYFTEQFAQWGMSASHRYELYPLESIDQLPALLASEPTLRGLNVTIPYKEQVIAYLDELAPGAADIGAVNTIAVHADGQLVGHNTDVLGFGADLEAFLRESGVPLANHSLRALVLGTGGAAKAVQRALLTLSIPYQTVSRRPGAANLTYDDLDEATLATHRLVINTTPLGMAPAVDGYPLLPYSVLGAAHLLYDLVYNPALTQFLTRGAAQGAKTRSGLGMLYGQADHAWAIWNALP